MYERFTERARKVMQLANQEARRFNHEYIGTEHILLGLVNEGAGVAGNVLKNLDLDIDLRKLRLEIEKIVPPGPDMVTTGKLPQTPRATKVIEYSIEEARNLNHDSVGTEHLLLGLLREQEGVAAQILMAIGLTLEAVREEIINLLGVSPPSAPAHFPFLELRSLPAGEFPAELRPALKEVDTPIEALTQEKEEAIAEQDFKTAARLRDQVDKLVKQKESIIREWRTKHLPDPAWLSWKDGIVATLARRIAEEGRWGDLPLLADALERAGCTDRELLSHCREEREHERGCWVIALLLGKT